MPLVHVTTVGKAREIVHSEHLKPHDCTVFPKKLLYLFALRPAYRLRGGDEKSHRINRFPFVFIISPEAVPDPYHVYPFDTGAAASGLFDSRADPEVYLEDYELGPTHDAAAGHIGWAYDSLGSYFRGDLRKGILEDVPYFETVTRSFVDIAVMASSGSNQPDKRASAIEIACDHNIWLKGNVELVILPKQYLEHAGHRNDDFIEPLLAQEIAWETYDWQPNTTPDEFQREISAVAESHFKTRRQLL